jgi:hypothetical protein
MESIQTDIWVTIDGTELVIGRGGYLRPVQQARRDGNRIFIEKTLGWVDTRLSESIIGQAARFLAESKASECPACEAAERTFEDDMQAWFVRDNALRAEMKQPKFQYTDSLTRGTSYERRGEYWVMGETFVEGELWSVWYVGSTPDETEAARIASELADAYAPAHYSVKKDNKVLVTFVKQ